MAFCALAFVAGCSPRPHTASAPPVTAPATYAAGTAVAGVPVAGLTQITAARTVRLALKPLSNRSITLRYGSHAYPRRWSDLGVSPDVDAMLSQAWTTPNVPLTLKTSAAAAKRSIRRAAAALDVPARAPRFTGTPGASPTRPGKAGRQVVVSASADLVNAAILANPDVKEAPLVVVPDEPDFTEADLQQIKTVVARYATRFNPRDVDRTYNLRLVARRLNGALIKPGGVFSFNAWVGERRKSEGFRDAIVYKEGKMVKDLAGGLCQVSSTLYNVALITGLPIVQRSHHSLTVHYVPLGRDATVYWGASDLRFQNNTHTPLYFRTRSSGNTLTVEAWGRASLQREVTVTTATERSGDTARAQVYRTIAENGRKRRELISQDTYSTEHVMGPVSPARRT
jgi:vancomycin resistance protein YoaR